MFPSLSKAISKKVTSAKDAVGSNTAQQQQPPQAAAVQHHPVPGGGVNQTTPPHQQQAWLDTETRQDSTKLCEEALAAIVQAYNQPMISHYKGQQRTRKALPEAIRLSVTLGSLKHEDAAGPLRDATLANAAVGNAIRAKDTFTGITTRVSEAKARLRAVAAELQAVRRAEEDDRELAQAVQRVADTPAAPTAGAGDIDDAPCESVDASPLKPGSDSSRRSSAQGGGDAAEVGSASSGASSEHVAEEDVPGAEAEAEAEADAEVKEAAATATERRPVEESEVAPSAEEVAAPSPDAADGDSADAAQQPDEEEDVAPGATSAAEATPAKHGGKSKKKKKR